MDISTVKTHIKNNTIQPFYIFSGPEWKVQRIYIEQIAKCKKYSLSYIDTITDVYSKLKNRSFVTQNYVYVVRDDKDIMTDEKLQSSLTALLGDNVLILLLTTVDKRTKFYKTYKDAICEFEPLKPAILKKYLKREISLSDKNCDTLMEICEYDYGRCLLEVDKIKQYDAGVGVNEENSGLYDLSFKSLLEEGIIYQPPKDAIFDFVDAVLKRQVNKSFDLLSQSYAVGEATVVLLSVLYNNVKQVLQVQSCESKDITKSTGLTGWQIKCAKEHINHYSVGELVYMLKLIQKCEKGIKTGQIEEQCVMPYILVNCL